MNFLQMNAVQFAIVIAGAVIVIVVGAAIWQSFRKRKSERLRTQFGGSEYARTVKDTATNETRKPRYRNAASESNICRFGRSLQVTGHDLSKRGRECRQNS